MKISKCIDDLRETLAYCILALICCVLLFFCLGGLLGTIISAILLFVVVVSCINEYIYFGRTIVLNQAGLSFCLGRYKKTYSWADIHVLYTENKRFVFGDGERPLPGIILSAKPIKNRKCAAMTYCKFRHPFSSVFLRFEIDTSFPKPAKRIFRGYIVKEQALIDSLKLFGKEIKKTGDGSLS